MRWCWAALAVPGIAAIKPVEWEQTAFRAGGKHDLLKSMPPLTLTASPEVPEKKALVIDRSEIFQEITGFGGAFTEAAAGNWRTLTESDQAEVIKRYFASPEEGGLGYTVGRVPINSCDFGPGEWWRTYSFDDVDGDVSLAHFDTTVSHDVSSGIIPMIQAAQAAIKGAGRGELTLFASPWSPPHWMKLPVADAWNASHLVRSMLRTALPNGLDPTMQRPCAAYSVQNTHARTAAASTQRHTPFLLTPHTDAAHARRTRTHDRRSAMHDARTERPPPPPPPPPAPS